MQSVKFKIEFNSDEDRELVRKYQRQYSSCLHVFYKMLVNEPELKSSYYYLSNTSNLSLRFKELNNCELMQSNTWLYRCAIKEALQIVKTNQQVVWGGKKNLQRRQKGWITREQWREFRLAGIYSIGTAYPYKGNQKFEILNDLETARFKPTRTTHIDFKLKGNKHRRELLRQLFEAQNSKKVPLTYKLKSDTLSISFEEADVIKYKPAPQITNRVMSIDMNPNYIGWSIVDWKSSSEFEVIKTGCYSFKKINDKYFELNGKDYKSCSPERKYLHNKLEHEVYEVCKNLINIALHYKVQLFGIEDLSFDQGDTGKGKKHNTLCHQLWFRSKIVNNITKRCNIHRIHIQTVKTEYSSIYGNLVFRSLNLPDPILASIEIGRRCYEFYNQYITQVKEIRKNIIQPTIEDFKRLYTKTLEGFGIHDRGFGSWYELYSYVKTLDYCIRGPFDLNTSNVLRCFS